MALTCGLGYVMSSGFVAEFRYRDKQISTQLLHPEITPPSSTGDHIRLLEWVANFEAEATAQGFETIEMLSKSNPERAIDFLSKLNPAEQNPKQMAALLATLARRSGKQFAAFVAQNCLDEAGPWGIYFRKEIRRVAEALITCGDQLLPLVIEQGRLVKGWPYGQMAARWLNSVHSVRLPASVADGEWAAGASMLTSAKQLFDSENGDINWQTLRNQKLPGPLSQMSFAEAEESIYGGEFGAFAAYGLSEDRLAALAVSPDKELQSFAATALIIKRLSDGNAVSEALIGVPSLAYQNMSAKQISGIADKLAFSQMSLFSTIDDTASFWQRIPDERLASSAAAAYFSKVAEQNAPGLSMWIKAHPSDPKVEVAVQSLVATLKYDPTAAAAWGSYLRSNGKSKDEP